jgi:hypothetical protein
VVLIGVDASGFARRSHEQQATKVPLDRAGAGFDQDCGRAMNMITLKGSAAAESRRAVTVANLYPPGVYVGALWVWL